MTAVQIKLDELSSAVNGARDELFDLEGLDEDGLEPPQAEFRRRAQEKRAETGAGKE
jgi:hypothetical protein